MADQEEDVGCCYAMASRTGLCCFIDEDEYRKQPLAEVIQNDRRVCTDLPCFLILIGFFVSEIILISYTTSSGGDLSFLTDGYDVRIFNDTESNVPTFCDDTNPDGPYQMWPDVTSPYVRVCTDTCDTTSTSSDVMVGITYPSTLFMDAYCIPDFSVANISSYDLPDYFTNGVARAERAVSDMQVRLSMPIHS